MNGEQYTWARGMDKGTTSELLPPNDERSAPTAASTRNTAKRSLRNARAHPATWRTLLRAAEHNSHRWLFVLQHAPDEQLRMPWYTRAANEYGRGELHPIPRTEHNAAAYTATAEESRRTRTPTRQSTCEFAWRNTWAFAVPRAAPMTKDKPRPHIRG